MIYFDNAATTAVKPPEVAEAVARAVNSFGGAGRIRAASRGAARGPARARAALPPSGTRAMCLLLNLRAICSTCYYGNSQYREELQWRTRAWPRIMPISACS